MELKITKKIETKYHNIEKILTDFKNGATYSDSIEKVQDILSSQITELLQGLISEIEGEKIKDINGKEGKYYRKDWNDALNLAQEKLRKIIK